MSVNINIPPMMRQYTNGLEIVKVYGNTVGECLAYLVKLFPSINRWLFNKQGKLQSYFNLCVNGRTINPEKLDKSVKPGDDLNILFIVSGG